MQVQLHLIVKKIISFALQAAMLAALVGLIFIDVHWLHNFVYETSLTELMQEVLLLAIALGFFISGWRQPPYRPARVLIGGFFLCMLIREMDFVFDYLHHGAWVWFALLTAIGCLVYALCRPAATVNGLAHFLTHPSYGMMCAGLLCILVFSRLFGMHQLWQGLMLDGYDRVVKNMVEEGCELVGYAFCLFASYRYLRDGENT
ncbi:hypothetical protein [Serratia odorifera]|nr:hypothetical protein [Serratia odorifera]MBJ2063775.1 hypothetical protein [Serratia odorifera]PNK89002.1 hypothetical protein CEQ31_004445 [Serratia odorifera]RII69970.1 hypothetical protein DX901_21855 [Serratia odorifera]HEJ9094959.1 hypothetical protein [Serratia odorifera]